MWKIMLPSSTPTVTFSFRIIWLYHSPKKICILCQTNYNANINNTYLYFLEIISFLYIIQNFKIFRYLTHSPAYPQHITPHIAQPSIPITYHPTYHQSHPTHHGTSGNMFMYSNSQLTCNWHLFFDVPPKKKQ